jgi:hypothetical protein
MDPVVQPAIRPVQKGHPSSSHSLRVLTPAGMPSAPRGLYARANSWYPFAATSSQRARYAGALPL